MVMVVDVAMEFVTLTYVIVDDERRRKCMCIFRSMQRALCKVEGITSLNQLKDFLPAPESYQICSVSAKSFLVTKDYFLLSI